jgi:carboxyl-terminal processing protease
VIGSQTAGADGDISAHRITRGNRNGNISGLGVYYPDNTVTQGKGVKIDVQMKPTIQGIRAGKDELLDKAVSLIQKH